MAGILVDGFDCLSLTLARADPQFFLKDLNSTNGTLLNREPVIGEELLHDRDEIGVGIYRLIFRYS